MRIDLHVHTSPKSPCSNINPAELIEEAKQLFANLGGIAETESRHGAEETQGMDSRTEQVRANNARLEEIRGSLGVASVVALEYLVKNPISL